MSSNMFRGWSFVGWYVLGALLAFQVIALLVGGG